MTSEVRSAKKRGNAPEKGFKQSQFINHSFTEGDKSQFKTWVSTSADEIWDLVDKALEGGYSLSIKHDTYHDCEACFLQTNDEKNQNFGFILTGRSRSGAVAVAAVLYRHYVLFEEQWPIEGVHRSSLDDE